MDSRLKMNDCPELYWGSSKNLKKHAKHFLEKYSTRLQWNGSGEKSIDIGSADGSTTMLLQQYLGDDYAELVGVDINENMVRFANEHYASDRVSFQVLDIEEPMRDDLKQRFHHVFSFFAVMWAQQQEKAFRNIYELMVEGGDCFLIFAAYTPMYRVYEALYQTEKWFPYLGKIADFLSPYYLCEEPDDVVDGLMQRVGFRDVDVRCTQMVMYFDGMKAFVDLMIGVDPFRIPEELLEDFRVDAEQVVRDFRMVRTNPDGAEVVEFLYNLLVVSARK